MQQYLLEARHSLWHRCGVQHERCYQVWRRVGASLLLLVLSQVLWPMQCLLLRCWLGYL
jgi:hypothetical protein